MNDVELPPKQKALFEALKGAGDVSIDALYEAVDGPAQHVEASARQQWLGSYLTRLNRRLRNHGLAVKPGEMKRTYRLLVV